MKKRAFLIGTLALALCFSLLSCAHRANDGSRTSGETVRISLYGAAYELDPQKGTCTFTALEDLDLTSFTILETVEGHPVEAIGSNAFTGATALTAVVLPQSVKEVRDSAFFGAEDLQTVFYGASESAWSDLIIGKDNLPLRNAQIYYYSADAPEQSKTCWHYVKGVPTIWAEIPESYGSQAPLN